MAIAAICDSGLSPASDTNNDLAGPKISTVLAPPIRPSSLPLQLWPTGIVHREGANRAI